MVKNHNRYRKETQVLKRSQINRPELLYFITIDIIKVKQQKYPEHDIITLDMDPMINIAFNKHLITWEIIHRFLLHPYDSVMT